jgi:hypothetical protein
VLLFDLVGLEQLSRPGIKIIVRFGPKLCSRELSMYVEIFELQNLKHCQLLKDDITKLLSCRKSSLTLVGVSAEAGHTRGRREQVCPRILGICILAESTA